MRNDDYRYRHGYGYGYGYGPGYYWPPSDGVKEAGNVVPDIKDIYKTSRNKMILFIILLAVSIVIALVFFMMFIIFISRASYVDASYFNIAYISLAFLLVGIAGIPLSAAFMTRNISKTVKSKKIKGIIDTIEAQDKINLQDLSKSKNITKDGLVRIINKLIETDNLRGYDVIGNVGVAKAELSAKERDFPQETEDKEDTAPSKNAQRIYKCPNCGAPITEQTGKFCTFCGVRLE